MGHKAREERFNILRLRYAVLPVLSKNIKNYYKCAQITVPWKESMCLWKCRGLACKYTVFIKEDSQHH